MSNYALQSEVSALQSQLRELESINSHLRHELGTVENGASGANRELKDINNRINQILGTCADKMSGSHNKTIASYELQGEIQKMYVRFKNIELANKKIRACNNLKYYDFANYRTVRKIVQGIMDNLDVSMISETTIARSVEKQHLQIPDYWLTCALISIIAWKNDDQQLAERAIQRAFKLDKKSSIIFFMLFNLRMGRDGAALKWFTEYQNCEIKGSDYRTFLMMFSLISKTLNDNVDESIKVVINGYIRRVIKDNIKSSGYGPEQVIQLIVTNYLKMRQHEVLDFSLIKRYSSDYSLLEDLSNIASNNINIMEFIVRTINISEEERNTYLKNYIDELVDEPNAHEFNVHEEINYNETIIKTGGEVEIANEIFQLEKQRKTEELNLVNEMIKWIYQKDSNEINPQMRLNMFVLTKEQHEEAVVRYREQYLARVKKTYQVNIDDYETYLDADDSEGEIKKISHFYNEKMMSQLNSISNKMAFIAFGASTLALIGAFFAGLWLIGGAGIGVLLGGGILLMNKFTKKQIQLTFNELIKTQVELVEKIISEFKAYKIMFNEKDMVSERILHEFSKV
jgi:hypothetical protein